MRPLLLSVVALAACSSTTPVPDLAKDGSLEGPGDGSRSELARDASGEGLRDGAAASCPPGVWCWANPLPNGNRLNAIHGLGEGELYAVGEGGTLLRSDGASWKELSSGVSVPLHAVFAAGPGKVVAVGAAGTILEGAGSSFKTSVVGKETLHGLWGSGPDDLYAVGEANVVLRYQGGSWKTLAPPDTDKGRLNAVWGEGPSGAVFVAGEKGKVYRLERASGSWSTIQTPYYSSLVSIHGVGAALWVGTPSGSVYRSTDGGKNWSSFSISNLYGAIASIWAAGPTEVYFVGGDRLLRFDGVTVSELATVTATGELRALFGAAGVLYLGGAGGALVRFKSGALQGMLPSTSITARELHAVFGRSAGEVYAVGAGGLVLRHDGSAWKKLTVPESGGEDLNGVWAMPGGPVFAVGSGGRILRFQGGKWTSEKSPTTAALTAVWGSDGTHVVAVGGESGKPVLVHFDGAVWSTKLVPSGVTSRFDSVWGSSPDNVYAVAYGAVVRFNGTGWTQLDKNLFKGEPVRLVWGRGANDITLVSDWGNVLHFDGGAWTVESAHADHPRAITGDAQSIAIALEDGGVVRGGGAGWVRQDTRCGSSLAGIWSGPGVSWAVGSGGTILRQVGP